jgi:hypothetical protein
VYSAQLTVIAIPTELRLSLVAGDAANVNFDVYNVRGKKIAWLISDWLSNSSTISNSSCAAEITALCATTSDFFGGSGACNAAEQGDWDAEYTLPGGWQPDAAFLESRAWAAGAVSNNSGCMRMADTTGEPTAVTVTITAPPRAQALTHTIKVIAVSV